MPRMLKFTPNSVGFRSWKKVVLISKTLSTNSVNLCKTYNRKCSIPFVFMSNCPFRELDYLRSQTETAQSLSATANSQAAAVLSQNIKLQSSAIKNQARNIDLEMKRIESKEAREHLNIVWVCVPACFRPFRITQPLQALLTKGVPGGRQRGYQGLFVFPTSWCKGRPHQPDRRTDPQPPRSVKWRCY